jgi:hypothetical protein
MAALDAEHYLQEVGAQEGKSDWLYLGATTTGLSKSLSMLKATLWWALRNGLWALCHGSKTYISTAYLWCTILISIQKPELWASLDSDLLLYWKLIQFTLSLYRFISSICHYVSLFVLCVLLHLTARLVYSEHKSNAKILKYCSLLCIPWKHSDCLMAKYYSWSADPRQTCASPTMAILETKRSTNPGKALKLPVSTLHKHSDAC